MQRSYYVHTRAVRRQGRSCHHHRVFDREHQLIAQGYLHRTFQPSPVGFSGDPEQPDVIVQLRKSFPITGKIDLCDARTGALLGVATRRYQLYDAGGHRIARFEDAEPRPSTAHTLAQFALDAALGSDGIGAAPSSRHFVLIHETQPFGTLRQGRLPFFPDPPRKRAPSRASNALRRLLPAKMRDALRATPPLGWTLALNEDAATLDERKLLCFALTTIEIRNWKSG